jgi:hypothetical protein
MALSLSRLQKLPLAICIGSLAAAGIHSVSSAAADSDAFVSESTFAITVVRAPRPTMPRAARGPFRPATTLAVTSCDDDGSPGTLRAVVAAAGDGDTVDLTQLSCGTITLMSGQISTDVDNLTIEGPGADVLTIDGNYGAGDASVGRVFDHGGSGTLTLDGLTITKGLIDVPYFAFEYGGCILSGNGSVELNNSTVTGCKVNSGFEARGGGIAARESVTINGSTVSNNVVSISGYYAYLVSGGGIHAGDGPLTITDSLIDGNRAEISYTQGDHQGISQAKGGGATCYGGIIGVVTISDSVISNNFSGCDTTSTSCYQAFAGGIAAQNGLVMLSSTLSNNTAQASGFRVSGGALYVGAASGVSASITNSTISYNHAKNGGGVLVAVSSTDGLEIAGSTIDDNSATDAGGGIWVAQGPLALVNTTISGNAVGTLSGGVGGGVYISGNGAAGPMSVKNATVTANTCQGPVGGGGIVDDNNLGVSDFESSIIAGNINSGDSTTNDADVAVAGGSVTGANNLIVAASGVTLPPDTLSSDPMLGPLQDNGGPTFTHALLAGSPAIDAGSNTAGLDFDQRGPGFARVSGAAADIGAFEIRSGTPDTIFADSFDGDALQP